MMRATLDLLGIYRIDNTVLDLLEVPEDGDGNELIDRDTLKDNLLMDTAEMEILYPDASFLKLAIGAWSKKQVPIWSELYASTQYEYNPIWNVDGTVVEERDLAGTDYRTDDHTTERTHDDSMERTHDDTMERTHDDTMERTHDDTLTTDNDVYGYNSATAAPESKVTADHDGTITDAHTGTITDAHTGTITDAHTGTITDTDTGTINHDTTDTGSITTTRTGNIGVTSTQSLIKEQRDVVQFNIMDYIINDFKNRFCLLVY